MIPTKPRHPHLRRGMALLGVLIIMVIIFIGVISTMSIVTQGTRSEGRRDTSRQLFFTSESGLQRGIFEVSQDETLPLTVLNSGEFADLQLGTHTLTVTITPVTADVYDIASVANDPTTGMDKTLWARVERTSETVTNVDYEIPKIFDYIYFLNNWAWFWGDTINAHGDSRSNGDFDLRSDPDVYGHLYAHGDIRGDAEGYGAEGQYRHPGSDYLSMPNLYNDFSYYEAMAQESASTVNQGGSELISAVHEGDLYLRGTPTDPIVIDGPIVVTGNLIIEGYVTGQGSFYVGNNIYLIDNLLYANGPTLDASGRPRPTNSDPSTPPTYDDRLAWVENNLNRDLVAYAARESIFFGDVSSTDWNTPMGYLDDWGDESNIGADGIPGTADDGIPFWHDWDGDGTDERSAWYDTDGDAAVDDDYTWADVRGPLADLTSFDNYPTNIYGNPVSLSTLANRGITNINGIFYTNHAFAGRTTAGPDYINGAIITKDEAIIFSNTIHLSYDERIHSDFRDPMNNVVDVINLDMLLPIVTTEVVGHRTQVIAWSEDTPLPEFN